MNKGASSILKVLHCAAPGAVLIEAVQHQKPWLPCFLATADTIPAGPIPFHSASVLAHTARCMDAVAGDPLAVWMALTHDAGKLTTPSALLPHHYGHELRGKKLASIWAQELDLSNDYAQAGVMTALLHMKAGRYLRLRPAKKYDLLQTVVKSGFFSSFWKVVDADTKSSISTTALADWQMICAMPMDDTNPELTRQRRISLLKTITSSNAKE